MRELDTFTLQSNFGYASGSRAMFPGDKSDSRGFTDFCKPLSWLILTSFFQPRGSPKYDPKTILSAKLSTLHQII